MNHRFIVSALAACLSVAAIGLVGCSGDDSAASAPSYSCSNKGPCPNDPVPSASEAASCESLSTDAGCGAAFSAYSACAYSAAICGDGGISDPNADSTSSACNSEYAAYTTCLDNKINASDSGS